MSNKYIITGNDDNSFYISSEGKIALETETKDMISFCMQYLYTVLNGENILLPESSKSKVLSVIKSFEFEDGDTKELSKLIRMMADNINKSMMTYDNGIPKLWEDEV
jgi:hypothetical protein